MSEYIRAFCLDTQRSGYMIVANVRFQCASGYVDQGEQGRAIYMTLGEHTI